MPQFETLSPDYCGSDLSNSMDQDSEQNLQQQLGEAAGTNGFLPGFLVTSRTNRGIQAAAGTQPCLQEQLGQPADPIGLSREFCTNQGEFSQAATGKQPLTQQLLGQSLTGSSEDPHSERYIDEISEEEALLVRKTEIEEIEEKEQPKKSSLKDGLGAQSRRWECKIEEKKKLRNFIEESRRSWNCKAFEAENRDLKRKTAVKKLLLWSSTNAQRLRRWECKIEEKKKLRKFIEESRRSWNCKAFEAENRDLKRKTAVKKLLLWSFSNAQRLRSLLKAQRLRSLLKAHRASFMLWNHIIANIIERNVQQLGEAARKLGFLSGFMSSLTTNQAVAGTQLWLQKQLGQSAETIRLFLPLMKKPIVSFPKFWKYQGQSSQTAVATQPTSTGNTHLQRNFDEIRENEAQHAIKREIDRAHRSRVKEERQALVDENDRLKLEIQEKVSLIQEKDQMIKSNMKVFKANSRRLKREIEGNEQLMKINLAAFEAEEWRLKREIEEKEQLMKSDAKAFENESLMREIEEKEPVKRSSLESEIRSLIGGIEGKVQLMKSKLEAFEAENGRLSREIEEKERLMESNMETLEVEISRLNNEMESLKGNNVLVNLRVQLQSAKLADLRNKYDELKQQNRTKKRPRISSTGELQVGAL